MNIEISKVQKEVITEKIGLCVSYLKTEVQPHLTINDKILVCIDESLDLCVTSKELCVKDTRLINLGIDFPVVQYFNLENNRQRRGKKFICDASPEKAVAFLKQWEKVKATLVEDVNKRKAEVNDLNQFIGGFQV